MYDTQKKQNGKSSGGVEQKRKHLCEVILSYSIIYRNVKTTRILGPGKNEF
jgi:hypothetical protein